MGVQVLQGLMRRVVERLEVDVLHIVVGVFLCFKWITQRDLRLVAYGHVRLLVEFSEFGFLGFLDRNAFLL